MSLEKRENILFVGEQNGSVERVFKNRIRNLLSKQGMQIRAYLVRISYDNSNKSYVALCFKTTEKREDLQLLNEATKIFKSMFGRQESLDMFFLTENEETKIRKVCCPFYTGKTYRGYGKFV